MGDQHIDRGARHDVQHGMPSDLPDDVSLGPHLGALLDVDLDVQRDTARPPQQQRGDIDRRSFVKKSVAAALLPGVLLGSTDLVAAVPQDLPVVRGKKRAIQKAVKFGMVQGNGSVQEKFALLKKLGYDGVELDSPSPLDREEVLRARDATGLPIHGVVDSVHWSKPFSHPDAKVRDAGVAALRTALEDCKAYGGTTVLVVPAVVSKDVPYDVAYERSQNEIRKVLPQAQELGIKIAFENVWNKFLLSPLEAVQYVDSFQSPMVGWYFDVGNVVNFGWPEQWVRILKHRILKLDVKEYSRTQRDQEGLWKGFQVKIGDGDCNWPEVTKALDEIGYRGWATAEVGGGGEERLADIAQRMDRVLGI